MPFTSSRSSPSASPTGALPSGLRQIRILQTKTWARIRRRGGGGLANPGPFRRIARAGGQKVTIRGLKRPFFLLGSHSGKIYLQLRRIFRPGPDQALGNTGKV